jgi:D-alanine--poly(phosphoribitol) ligase subunit 1
MYSYNIFQNFLQTACRFSENIALRCSDGDVTYQQLLNASTSLALLLLRHGCTRGDVIAIGHDKRPLSYALMLAGLRLGVVYVNIDTASPACRNRSILQTSGASVLFYDDPGAQEAMEALATTEIPLVFLDDSILPDVFDEDRALLEEYGRQVDGSCIAYIMFTSGSTGVPKGVAVTHQNVLHFIHWGKERFSVTDSDNFANLSPMYFDNSVFDFYVALFSGASLTPIPRGLLAKPYELVPYVGRMGCTVWFSVPSLLIYLQSMKALAPSELPRLRTIVFGGEGYPKPELKKLYDRFFPQACLVNVYGPTECTCICSAYTISQDDFSDSTGLPPLGRLNPNFDYRILDEEGRDAAKGELCLIGPNVAAGYFADLERTAAAFHVLTAGNRFMKRMYRTGDIVREEHGILYFICRKDNQIKHMGYRIELEEIEHSLSKLPPVTQAAVVYHRTNTAYGKLVGFVACSGPVDEKALLQALAELVPEYMVPSRLQILAELPKNPNGKVDRQRLSRSLDT